MTLLPFKLEKLTKEMEAKAEAELNETNETRQKSLEELRKRISEIPKLQNCRTDDEYLLIFLRARKFQMERAVGQLQNFHRLHRQYDDIFKGADFEVCKMLVERGVLNILPYRDKNGCAILYMDFEKWSIGDTDITSVLLVLVFGILLTATVYPASQVCGIKILYNLKGLSWNLLPHLSMRVLIMVVKCYSQSLPIRIKGISAFNEMPVMYYLWNLVKHLFPVKVKNRIHFHSTDMESLYREIPAYLLPEELGGQLKLDPNFILQIPHIEELYREYMNIKSPKC